VANHFHIIRHGRVALQIFVPHRGEMTFQTLSDSDVLGWSWFVPPYRRHFNAQALESTRALAFDAACLRKKCEEDHDLGYELMRRFVTVIVERLQTARIQMTDMYGLNT
jgi:CRP/FNR family transcriptional regulator, cyclic AMP receptor protein